MLPVEPEISLTLNQCLQETNIATLYMYKIGLCNENKHVNLIDIIFNYFHHAVISFKLVRRFKLRKSRVNYHPCQAKSRHLCELAINIYILIYI